MLLEWKLGYGEEIPLAETLLEFMEISYLIFTRTSFPQGADERLQKVMHKRATGTEFTGCI